MRTDWTAVRAMMGAAIDACEEIERLGYGPENRAATREDDGPRVSAFDIVTSAYVLPESVRYAIVRARHEAGADLPYVPETARILTNMAAACAELIGAEPTKPAADGIARMLRWYNDHAMPRLKTVLGSQTT